MAVALCSETVRDHELQMDKWLGKFRNGRVEIVLIGDTKSLNGPFLSNTLGMELAHIGVCSPSFQQVYCDVGGVRVTATLIPALSDAEGYKDERYFECAQNLVWWADLVIYCIDMSDTRLRGSVLRTLLSLETDWSRTVIVLTFADALPALIRHRDNPDFPIGQYFNTKVAEWTGELTAMLQRIGVQQEVVAKIKVHPTAHKPEDLLPNGEPWLAPLSLAIMDVLSPKKKAEFLKEHATLLPTVTTNIKQMATPSQSPSTTSAAEIPFALSLGRPTKAQSSESNFKPSSVSSGLSEDQLRPIRAALSKLRKDCPEFGILVIGRTGVGKSTLINNLLGKEVASVGHTLQSETPEVNRHEDTVEGVPIVVYDTPGLGDVKGEEDERLHLEIMKEFLSRKKIHLVVYCFQMNETLMTSSLIGAMKKYHKIGVNWERSVIALTFADALYVPKGVQKCPDFEQSDFFDARLASHQKLLRYKLENTVGVKSDVVEQLKFFPTSLLPTDQLPNGNPWYVPLWLHIVEILSPAATVRFVELHRNNICEEQAPALSQPVKVEVKLVGEYKHQFTVTLAATVEAAGMDNSEKSALLSTISKAAMGAIGNWFSFTSDQAVALPPQDTAGRIADPAASTNCNSTQNHDQTQSGKESILSQNVYKRQGHLMLLREHVSRKAAGKGRAVLEGLWLDAAMIEACFNNPQNEESAVQAGIIKWIGGVGRQPPTWGILLEVMRFAGIAQQHVENLKKDLGL